jgi:glucose uptake protein
MGILYAVVTVLAWGAWLAPSQRISFGSSHVRTFYIAAANLALTFAVLVGRGLPRETWSAFWLPFAGGLIWAVSGYCAFAATVRVGMAGASGVWTPLNIVVGMIWGAALFSEFGDLGPRDLALLVAALVVIIGGILLIILARGGRAQRSGRSLASGVLLALAAGVLWGSYFIPIRMARVSLWEASFPLAAGMFVGSAALVGLARAPLALPHRGDYGRVCLSGLLWGLGNYGMLLLTEALGTGRGFTIAQLGVVVNALIAILVLRDPRPGTRAATITFVGVLLATLGGVVLGNLG